jgi:ATP-dependent DNA helicase RecG
MKTSLASLLQRSPLQLELMPEPDAARLADTLVAFANTEGGAVVLGVDPTGRPTGTLTAEDAESALKIALAACRPLVRTEWQPVDQLGQVIAIQVPRSTDLHALADGRVLIRSSAGNEALDGIRISHLAASKASGDFEAEVIAGARRSDLDDDVIEDYLRRRAVRLGRDLGQDTDDILMGIGALSAQGQPTAAGMLLFGKDPQALIPQSKLTYVRFPGTEPSGGAGEHRYTRRQDCAGALARVIESVWSVLLQEMRGEAVVRGLQREDRYVYPPNAVREALVNAVCHRDYRIAGRGVEIRHFDDRLEIFSPGGLPGYITLDNIVEEHFSRNPRVVNGLFEWGYIEELGLGIDRIIGELLQNGHPQPEFKATPYSFTLIMRRATGPARRAAFPVEWGEHMNERQIRAMQHLQQHGRITNRDFRELCPDVSPETLRLDLTDLVDKGLVMKIGEKKGTYYILK